MLNWLKTQKRRIILTGVAAVLVSLLLSITLFMQHQRQEEKKSPVTENAAGKDASQGQNNPQSRSGQVPTVDHGQASDLPLRMIPENRMSTFAREPAPAEVTRKLEAMDVYERKTEEKKLTDLQIVWPLYFFSLTKRERDTASVMLDASETGFGVIIVTEISLRKYPGMATAQPGDKIWLAGKIAGVDTHGTGQITLVTEYIGFTDEKRDQ